METVTPHSPPVARPLGQAEATPPASRPAVTVGEVAVLTAILGAGLIAWASLALAHVGQHSGIGALVLGTVATAAIDALVFRRRHRPRLTVDRAEIAALAALAVLAGVMYFPGFPYAVAEKDPGVYVAHGFSIARTGSYELTDPVLSPDLPPSEIAPGARFAGVWINDRANQRIVPQFFHLYAATLATADDLAGPRAVFNLNPLFGVLSVLALFLCARRALGTPTALLAGALLATNMMQIWSAKYPATEAMTQTFVLGATLGVILAISTRWRPIAGAAGILCGLTLLARVDGVLFVLLAIGLGAALFAFGRLDARAGWFGAGLAVTLPHALLQAYDTDFAGSYARTNEMPGWKLVLAVVVVLWAGAAVWRAVLARPAASVYGRLRDRLPPDRAMLLAGLAMVGLATALLLLGYARPRLFGEHMTNYNGRIIRSFNEQNVRRLGWFLTQPGNVLMVGGLAVVALRRWKAAVWVLVGPGVLLLPLYLQRSRISSRLMWWTRRYVTFAIAVALVLIAAVLVYGLVYRHRDRVATWVVRGVAALATVFVLGSFLQMSWPLRAHREFGGSYGVSELIADTAGDRQGVFLWQYPRQEGIFAPAKLFGAPLWLIRDQISAVLPKNAGPADVDAYRKKFPGQPVFVLTSGRGLDPALAGADLRELRTVSGALPLWEESDVQRPARAIPVPFVVEIYQVRGT